MPEITSRLSAALADRYRIARRLGEGGMATVYLAEDRKHDRKVALKVLKPELAAVLGADRFVQEIKTTASLQHPNILPLFDSGEADGFLYYVMPYVDGETLRDKLNREKQLAIEEAVQLAGEVAEALDSAHQQGVIHRDIKPENILLHNGRPMVADFGIALAVSAAAGGRMTETGLSLGTPHYMSPEQATAEKDLTGRSDVYSLGAVLYEMLTGEPPHTGSTAQQIIMKIVTDAVRPVTEVRRSVPPNVGAAVAKALEKIPADRFDSAAGFRRALGDTSFTTGVGDVALGPASTIRGTRFWIVATAVSMLAAAAIATVRFRGAVPPSSTLRASLPLPKLGEDEGLYFQMDISPDGEYVAATGVLGGEVGIWVRPLDSLEWRLLPRTTRTGDVTWSPDSRSLAFFDDQDLNVASVGGGPVHVLAHLPAGNGFYASAAWSRDGIIVFSPPALGPLFRISATGGEPEPLTTVASQTNHRFPVFLPDGKHFLYTSEGGTDAGIYVASLDDPAGIRLLADPSPAVFARATHGNGGYLFFVRDGRLMVQPFDPGSRGLQGEPVVAVERVPWSDNGSMNVSVSDNGVLAYMGGRNRELDSRLGWTDRSGATLGAVGMVGAPSPVSLSPDERTAAVVRRPAASTRGDVWLWDLERGVDTPFTFDSPLEGRGNVVWAPAGDRIAFVVSDSGSWRLIIGDVTDKRQQEVFRSETAIIVTDWTRSGDLIYTQLDPETGSDIWRLPVSQESDRSADPQALVRDRFNSTFGQVSPDGRWVAYLSNETGGYEVWVASFPSGTDRWVVSQTGGGPIGAQQPRWSRDGRELFYSMQGEGSRSFMTAPVRTPGEAGSSPLLPAQPLFKARANGYAPFQGTFFYDVSHDGERFLVDAIEEGGAGDEQIIHVIVNWEEIVLGGR